MELNNRLDGHKVLITGAGGGIGASTARVCASLGAEVLLLDLQGVDELVTELGSKAHAFVCDVRSRAEIERIAGEVGNVQAVVAGAAICPWDDWNDPDWDEVFDRVIDVNLLGVIHVTRAFMPGMVEQQYGRIVVVGSLAGRMGGLVAAPHYVASKGGVIKTEEAYRRELSKGCPHALDDDCFYPAAVEACSYWLVNLFSFVTHDVLLCDDKGGTTVWQKKLLLHLDILAATAKRFGHLEAIGVMAGDIASKLHLLWPKEAQQMPYYPAFQRS